MMDGENLPPTLAEGRWFWRRLYVYMSSAGAWLLLERLVRDLPPAAVPPLAERLMVLLGLTMVLYLVAPTAQQLCIGLHRLLQGGRR